MLRSDNGAPLASDNEHQAFLDAVKNASPEAVRQAASAGTEHLLRVLGEDPPGLLRCQVCGNHPARDSEFGVLCHLDYTRELAAANPVPLPRDLDALQDLAVLGNTAARAELLQTYTELSGGGKNLKHLLAHDQCQYGFAHVENILLQWLTNTRVEAVRKFADRILSEVLIPENPPT